MLDSIYLEIGRVYKLESGRVLASLIRILGDLDLAEEALQEAFTIATEKWPREGIPKNPYSWLITTGKFKAIDAIRRTGRGKALIAEKLYLEQELAKEDAHTQTAWHQHVIEDDQLRLIFFCCHPLLPLDSRIALSLREVCGMSTPEIARAYLLPVETVKKRISRAKTLIREKQIPYEIPTPAELNPRMAAVLHVIYLVFNEGYSATSGDDHLRKELSQEAVFLCRQLVALAATSESLGLLALLLLQESRSMARVTGGGDLVPLAEQNRSLWDQDLIREGVQLIQTAIMSGQLGPYALQAAIASVHALADSVKNTQWALIIDYYDMLLSINPTPVVELNRAIAIGMHHGPETGLALIERLLETEKLKDYPAVYAAQGEFCKKSGLIDQAVAAYRQAINLARQKPEARYLQKQLDEIL